MKDSRKKVNFFVVLLSGLRHRWLVYFRPRYTIVSLLRRKGQCKACGLCCFLNTPGCRHLKDGNCALYASQPFFCRVFPIDEKDKEMSGVSGECGYYWESK
ncbi:MAG: hypothetical protein WC569_06595 [Candidatus Omnitrophota bacterium]